MKAVNVHQIPDQENREDRLTRQIERYTGSVPSLAYLGLAVASMGVSAMLQAKRKESPLANFFGLWAPSILTIGIYNKLVKIEDMISENTQNAHRKNKQA